MAPLIPLLLKTAGPWLFKQLPRLWPLLLEAKNRERLMEAVNNLVSQSPSRRLKAKAELTAALAESMVEGASSEQEQTRARDWSRRARNLALRLDMPTADRSLKRSQTASVERQLTALQTEMDRYLDQPGDGPPSTTEQPAELGDAQ